MSSSAFPRVRGLRMMRKEEDRGPEGGFRNQVF